MSADAESFFEAMNVMIEADNARTMAEFFGIVATELNDYPDPEPGLALDGMMTQLEQQIHDDPHADSTRSKELAAGDVLAAVTSARKWLDHLEKYAKNYGSKR